MLLSRKPALLLLFGAMAAIFALLWIHSVNNSLTLDDRYYINRLLAKKKISDISQRSYEDEIKTIKAVQDAILTAAPIDTPIPTSRTREPKDLYQARSGLCYDRSRVIEKALRQLGFKTRHIFLYEADESLQSVIAIIFRPLRSHAVTEVKTARGWLVVDSNARWLSLNKDGLPVSISQIKRDTVANTLLFETAIPHNIYHRPFRYVFGLYSRHGLFYPPFTPIPDVHYGELLQNVVS